MKTPTQALADTLADDMKRFVDRWKKFGLEEQMRVELHALLIRALQAGSVTAKMEAAKERIKELAELSSAPLIVHE